MARDPSSSRRLEMYSGDGPIFTPRMMRAVYRAQPSASSMTIGKSPVILSEGVALFDAGVEGPAVPGVILSGAPAGREVEGPVVAFCSLASNSFNSTP